MMYNDNRFAKHQRFRFFALNTEMRWRALQTGRVYVKQHPGDAQLSLDELRDMVGREGETFSNRVSTVSESTKTFLTVYLLFTKVSMYLSINGRVRKYSNAGYSSVGGVIHCAVQYIIGASVSEPPLVDSTDALSCTIYIYIYTSVRHPLLRMRGATRKRSRPDRESSQFS